MHSYSQILGQFFTQLSSGDSEFKLRHLSPLTLNLSILLAGIPVFVIALVLTRFFRPRVLSAGLVLGPIPLFIAFLGIIEQFDRSMNSTAFANALLMIVLGIGSSLPACVVLARGILMHVNEQNRR